MKNRAYKVSTLIDQHNLKSSKRVRPSLLREVVRQAVRLSGLNGSYEVAVTITDDFHIRQLNSEYRQVDSATDVLSFPILEDGKLPVECATGRLLLGDIVISIDTAKRQALEDNVSLEQMVAWLLSHGMLHLMGVNHDTEEMRQTMNEREKQILHTLGIPVRVAKLYNK